MHLFYISVIKTQLTIVCFSRRNLTPDAISFAQKSLDAGAKPLLVRKNLMLEFGANLLTKDVLNLKTKLSGK